MGRSCRTSWMRSADPDTRPSAVMRARSSAETSSSYRVVVTAPSAISLTPSAKRESRIPSHP